MLNKIFPRIAGFLLIVIVCLVALGSLYHPGIPITHDGQDHLARIANFYQSLSDGNIVPRWAANLNWGFGHPILTFLYPFPSYFASLFLFLGFSLAESFKIVIVITYILSGIGMYLWVRNVLNNNAGIVAALLYIFAPYRFVDIFVRGAIGEHVAFTFLPFILYFMLKLSENEKLNVLSKRVFLLLFSSSLSISLLILSHNAITLMFLPIILFYALFLVFTSKRQIRVFLLNTLSVLSGFVLSSFFLIPAFLEGKYTLRDIVTGKDYVNHFITWNRFFLNDWSFFGSRFFSVQLGWVHLALALMGLALLVKFKGKNKKLLVLSIFIFLYLLLSLFLMTKESLFIWKDISILQKFQFPWRFLSVSIFTTAFLGSIPFYFIKKTGKGIGALVLLIIAIFSVYNYQWKADGYLVKNESFYKNVYNGTTDTGESGPIWSVRFMEKRPKVKFEFVTGKGSLKIGERTSTRHTYQVNAMVDSRVKENTLYFPGWTIFVNGQMVQPQFQDPLHRGLMTFNIKKGNNNIVLQFKETKLRLFADYLSIGGLIGFIIYGMIVFARKK